MLRLAASRAAPTLFPVRGGGLLVQQQLQRRIFHASPEALAKLNVEGLAEMVNLKGKNVLVRVDLNVPLAKVRSEVNGQDARDFEG